MKTGERIRTTRSSQVSRAVLLVAIAFALGCAGGGGGATRVLPPPVILTFNFPQSCAAPVADEAACKSDLEVPGEYEVPWLSRNPNTGEVIGGGVDRHLGRINAAAAYARGATGAGETIIMMDSGIRETHREFARSVDPATSEVIPHAVRSKQTAPGYTPSDTQKGHGTAVAAIAVGRRNGEGMQGVAFKADLHFIEVNLAGPPGPGGYRLTELAGRDQGTANFFGNAVDSDRGHIVSFSFGVAGAVTAYEQSAVQRHLRLSAAKLAQAGTPDADKKIIVWPAGNARGHTHPDGSPADFSSPELLAGLGYYFPELQRHVIAVAALDQDGGIARYSNHCGVAKSFCLAAPGSDIFTAESNADDSYRVEDGTSLAVPIVSGSLALLRQYFRGQLGSTELVDRLLATANRDGIYANSDIYGHGLVDLDAATAPVGMMMTGLRGDPGSRAVALSDTVLSLGPAFGDGLARSLAGREIAAFDSLNAPFWYRLGGFAKRAERSPLRSHLRGFMKTPASERAVLSAASPAEHFTGAGGQYPGAGSVLLLARHSAPPTVDERFGDMEHLAFTQDISSVALGAENGFSVSAFAPDTEARRPMSGAVVSYHPRSLPFGLRAGWVSESGSLLGSSADGAFGSLSADTVFAGLGWSREVGPWTAGANTEIGFAVPKHTPGLIDEMSGLTTSAFSFDITRVFRGGHSLSVSLSQPLRVESGGAELSVPVGRTKNGVVVESSLSAGLVPSGRQIDFGLRWKMPLRFGDVTFATVGSRHPGHDEHARMSLSLLAGWSRYL